MGYNSTLRKQLGAQPGQILDHRDRNYRNNLPHNIRLVTSSVNNFNKDPDHRSRTGVRGVMPSKKGRFNWIAYINKNKKRIATKRFETFEEAVSWRRMKELQYYGENL